MAAVASKAKEPIGVNPTAKIGVELLSHEPGQITAFSLHHSEEALDMVGHRLIEHRPLR